MFIRPYEIRDYGICPFTFVADYPLRAGWKPTLLDGNPLNCFLNVNVPLVFFMKYHLAVAFRAD
jgi:hypothetical protein